MIFITYNIISRFINQFKNNNDDIVYNKCENDDALACLREIIIHKLSN